MRVRDVAAGFATGIGFTVLMAATIGRVLLVPLGLIGGIWVAHAWGRRGWMIGLAIASGVVGLLVAACFAAVAHI